MAFFVIKKLPEGRQLHTFAIVKAVGLEEVEVVINAIDSDCSYLKVVRKPLSLSKYIELVEDNNFGITEGWREENRNLMLDYVLTKFKIFRGQCK